MTAAQSRNSRYFPARCAREDAPFLVEVEVEAEAGQDVPSALACPSCGGEAILIPTAYYTEVTRSKFEPVASLLHEARLSPLEASALARMVFDELGAGTRDSIRHAFRRVPKLRPLEAFVPLNQREVNAFVALVQALLEVYADAGRFSADSQVEAVSPDAARAGP